MELRKGEGRRENGCTMVPKRTASEIDLEHGINLTHINFGQHGITL